MIEINSKSWYVRLNRWVFGICYTPKTLCPLIWRTLFIHSFFPLILFFKGLERIEIPQTNFSDDIVDRVGRLAFWLMISSVLIGVVWGILNGYLMVTLILLGVISAIVISGFYLVLLQEFINDRLKQKPRKINVAKETIKSLYHKYCPLVEII